MNGTILPSFVFMDNMRSIKTISSSPMISWRNRSSVVTCFAIQQLAPVKDKFFHSADLMLDIKAAAADGCWKTNSSSQSIYQDFIGLRQRFHGISIQTHLNTYLDITVFVFWGSKLNAFVQGNLSGCVNDGIHCVVKAVKQSHGSIETTIYNLGLALLQISAVAFFEVLVIFSESIRPSPAITDFVDIRRLKLSFFCKRTDCRTFSAS